MTDQLAPETSRVFNTGISCIYWYVTNNGSIYSTTYLVWNQTSVGGWPAYLKKDRKVCRKVEQVVGAWHETRLTGRRVRVIGACRACVKCTLERMFTYRHKILNLADCVHVVWFTYRHL